MLNLRSDLRLRMDKTQDCYSDLELRTGNVESEMRNLGEEVNHLKIQRDEVQKDLDGLYQQLKSNELVK